MAFSSLSSISSFFNKKNGPPPIVYTDFSELSMRYIYDNTNCYCAYNASNYNVSTKTFTDMSKSTNIRNGNITFPGTSTAPTLVRRTAAGNGATVSNFPVVAGVGASNSSSAIPSSNCSVLADTNSVLQNSTNYTIIYVARKKTTANNWIGTIFGGVNGGRGIIFGWWNNTTSGSYFTGDNWYGTAGWGNDPYTTNFFIGVVRPTSFRTNARITAGWAAIPFPGLEINSFAQGTGGLDFEIAEILVFKTALTDTAATGTLSVNNIVTTLKTLYGINTI